MKKYFLLATILLQTTFLLGQTHPLYNKHGVYLDYAQTKYNSVELNGETYDQYEVVILFRNDNLTSYVHEPLVCRVTFSSDVKHPSSSSEFDFFQNGEAHGYVEYTDGTPLPENLNNPKEEEKYGRIVSRMVIEPKQINKCTKYILLKSGSEFPEPNWSLQFDNQIPVIVNGSRSLVATWVDRQAKGISLNNVSSWPMIIRKPFDGTNCGNARPIGNKGDVVNRKVTSQDVKKALKLSTEEKYNITKAYFQQAGYKMISEHQNSAIIFRESKNSDGSPYISKAEYFFMTDFGSFKLFIDKEENSIGIVTFGENEDNLLDKLLEPFEIGRMGDPPGENGEPSYTVAYIMN